MRTRTKIIIAAMVLTFVVAFCSYAVHERNRLLVIYNDGVELLEAGECEAGIERLQEIPNWIQYRDVQELLVRYRTVLKYQYEEICPYCGHVLK